MKLDKKREFALRVLNLRKQLSGLILKQVQDVDDAEERAEIVMSCISMMYVGLWKGQKLERDEFLKLCETAWRNYQILGDLQ